MKAVLAVGLLVLLAGRAASACPCGGHEAYGPVEMAPDEGESVTADAHVWLWFSKSFHGLRPDRPEARVERRELLPSQVERDDAPARVVADVEQSVVQLESRRRSEHARGDDVDQDRAVHPEVASGLRLEGA
jgi:hypothetical protein